MPTHAPESDKVLHWARGYDLLVWVLTLGRERRFRDRLVDLARVGVGESVLDVGCGTGGLALAAKDRVGSGGHVCAVDASPEMVARARRKAARAGVDVRFDTAVVESLPFPDATFDVVLSSLMLHHLTDEGRREGIGEVGRVLKPGGRWLAVDIGGGQAGIHTRIHALRQHAGFDLRRLVPVLAEAGFQVVDDGPVGSPALLGLSNLRFVLAVTRPAAPG